MTAPSDLSIEDHLTAIHGFACALRMASAVAVNDGQRNGLYQLAVGIIEHAEAASTLAVETHSPER